MGLFSKAELPDLPDEVEQAIARAYVLERKLFRPKTNAKHAILFGLLLLLGPAIIGSILYYLLFCCSFAPRLPDKLAQFRQSSPAGFCAVFFVIVYFVTAVFAARPAAILAVRVYQHYSPDEVRRRCLFKPTCSEYAIMCFKKYGFIIGGIKTFKRLFIRCSGNVYGIDYPYKYGNRKKSR